MVKVNKLDRQNVEDVLGLTPLQEGMLFDYLQDRFSDTYFEQLSLRLQGSVDGKVFRAAWDWVVQQNEVLRTIFAWEKVDKPVQIILKEQALAWAELDLSAKAGDEQAELLRAIKEQDRRRGFVLEEGPLFRVTLCKIQADVYELILSNHHIIYDGWSNGNLLREFFTAYAQMLRGRRPDGLRKSKFKEYLQWIRRQNTEGQQAYWKEYLRGYQERIDFRQLPGAFEDATLEKELQKDSNELIVEAAQGSRNGELLQRDGELLQRDEQDDELLQREGELLQRDVELMQKDGELLQQDGEGGITYVVSSQVAMQVYDFTKTQKITLGSFFYTVWGICLQKLLNVDDVLFGTTFAGRPEELPGIEEMVGLFINTLPLRVRSTSKMTVEELSAAVALDVRGQNQFAAIPLWEIKSLSEISGAGTLFNTLVVVENYPLATGVVEESGLVVLKYELAEQTKFDITLEVLPWDDLTLKVKYQPDLVTRQLMAKIMTYFCRILEQVVENPSAKVAELELITEREKNVLLKEFNDTQAVYPRDLTLHGWFQEKVLEFGEEVALLQGEESWTYREFNECANRLARVLRKRGVGANTIVGLLTRRSFTMLVGIYAILKAGGAYLPLDPDYPAERVRYMLEDSAATVLLVQDDLYQQVGFEREVILLDAELDIAGDRNTGDLDENCTPRDLAYIIYTSGSTGKPKGVMIEHRSVLNVLTALQERYPCAVGDAYLFKTPFTFDVSVAEIFGWFPSGGRLVILENSAEKDPEALREKIIEDGVTHVNFVPAMFGAFLETLATKGHVTEQLGKLRYAFLAGEALPTEMVRKFKQLAPQVAVENLYGPTEATVYTTYFSARDWVEKAIVSGVPIGRPLANVQVYILDQHGNVQPIGVPGELYIAGAGLARGYLHRPELTAEKFVACPFSPEARMYRTGDLARWLPDGNIEFLGRIDHQVKVRGYRIEPGEIESLLEGMGGIREAVVIDRKDSSGNTYLVAYIVPTANNIGAKPPANAVHGHGGLVPGMGLAGLIRQYLVEHLPEYMIPAFFVELESIPLTSSGKIDRKVLPEPELGKGGKDYQAPQTEWEEKLQLIWQDVLHLEKVGVLDNFFELGGHSIMATQLVSRILKEFELEVTLKEIFQHVTIREQAKMLENAEQKAFYHIAKTELREHYPLTAGQKRVYFFTTLAEEKTLYNIFSMFLVKGVLDRARLSDAFKQVVLRHEALRMVFPVLQGEPVQQVLTQMEFELEELWAVSDDVERVAREFCRPFDLEKGPLFRIGILQVSGDKAGHCWLLVDLHHLIADGLSMEILLRELNTLYTGGTLPDLRVQFSDYVLWQEKLAETKQFNDEEAYWMRRFAENSADEGRQDLPTDFPRPVVQGFAGDTWEFTIQGELADRLEVLALREGATLFMVLFAGYNLLLGRYTNSGDVTVGIPATGRQHEDLHGMIGMFVNTLAIRNRPEDQSFREFLAEVRESVLQAFLHQDYPFEMLVERLNWPKDPSRNPLFDTMFSLQKAPKKMQAGELTLTLAPVRNNLAKFDLVFEGLETEEGVDCSLQYCSVLYKRETVQRMVTHYLNLLWEITENPEKRLSQLEMLTPEEREQLIFEFNQTEMDYPGDKTAHELFEEQVARAPKRIALVDQGEQWSYCKLNEQANQMARLLRAKGVHREKIVGILTRPSAAMIVGILAILKAGGAYLPLDPDYPPARLLYMLRDSGAQILLTQRELVEVALENGGYAESDKDRNAPSNVELFPGSGELARGFLGELVLLDEPETYQGDTSNLTMENSATDLAYVIYTSGSTGEPKGVMIEQRALVNLCYWYKRYYAVTADDRTTKYAGPGFDASVMEIFPYLLVGATIYTVPLEMRLDVAKLAGFIQEYGITISFLPTPVYEKLLVLEEAQDVLENSALRVVLTGGDKLQHFHQCKYQLFNNYGPTENTVVSTAQRVQMAAHNIPIGRPIDNTRIYVLDRFNRLQPPGVIGEICLAGDGLARGYLHREELTQEKFVENPLLKGQRLYRTGDRGRWSMDGNLFYEGRIDRQIKVRGFRIEIGEIEFQLMQYPQIQQAVVVAHEDSQGEKYLGAYWTADSQIDVEKLRGYLDQQLPGYMIPAVLMQLAEMPLTANGKIDRRALPEPDLELRRGVQYVAPHTGLEARLVKIWEEVLGCSEIGIDDNFFARGGHSLKATQLAGRIAKELNLTLPLSRIFQSPTIRQLAEYLAENLKTHSSEENLERCVSASGSGEMASYIPLEVAPVKAAYPVSSAQKRLFILDQIQGGSVNYNNPIVLRVSGRLEKDRLEQALKTLIQRHESLRTFFVLVNGEPVQRIAPQVDFGIAEVVLEDATPRRGEIAALVLDLVKPFDLGQAPLLRAVAVGAQDQLYLLFDMHHIISDGTSMGIFVEELGRIYSGEELPPLRVQYKDFTLAQQNFFASEHYRAQEEYWFKRFHDDVPLLNLPLDYPRPALMDYAGDVLYFIVEQELLEKLKDVALAHRATLYMVLLAVFNVLLQRYSGQEDIVVGSPVAGRQHPDVQGIIGMFVNTLAMRNFPTAEKTFGVLLDEVRDNSLAAYANQDYQYDMLVEQLHWTRDAGRNPLFDTVLALQNTEMPALNLPGVQLELLPAWSKVAKFDITLNAVEDAEGLTVRLEYRTRLFKRRTVERMVEHFRNIIDAVGINSELELKQIRLLSKNEEAQILAELTGAQASYPGDMVIHQLFEEKVAKTPEHIAVSYEGQKMTYWELNQQANLLARVLRQKGVERDSIVAILLERSGEMIIGILAILKAGGAYLPIDPDYPQERKEYMLTDSGTKILLTRPQLARELSFAAEIVYLHSNAEDADKNGELSLNLENINQSGDLAYIIYTSGSTGKPKGVMVEHRNVIRLMTNDHFQFDFSARDVWTVFHSFCFDFSVWEMYGALLYGGKAVIIPKMTAQNTQQFLALLKREQVTVLNQTPTAFYNLSSLEVQSSGMDLRLRYVIFGGEALKPLMLKSWQEKYPQTRLINMYGITETTVHVTFKEITATEIETNVSNIGKPIPTLTAYIFDKNGYLQPVGVPGELCVGGAGVARGYLNRPELTQEKFVANPLKPGERIYRSGDLVRLLNSGEMEYLGRIDRQVKIRGFRIELGEIERQLLLHPAIRDAVVIDREDAAGNKFLLAYVVQVSEVAVADLRKHLLQTLPEYMIPAYFVRLDTMPLTPNGKIDRKALPEPNINRDAATPYVPPSTPTEERLAQLWEEILRLPRVGRDDNFFELGGHSLNATQLLAKVFKEFAVEFALKQIFTTPVLSEMAKNIDGAKQSLYVEIAQVPVREAYPVSSAQKRMLILHEMEDSGIYYNMPMVMELIGEINWARLENTFQSLIARHESLRTSFALENGEWVQKIAQDVDFTLARLALPTSTTGQGVTKVAEPASETEESQGDFARQMQGLIDGFIQPFDLQRAPLMRAGLVEAHARHFLLIDLHHIIADGASLGILMDDFVRIYAGELLTELRIQYKDFTVWQNDFLQSEDLKAEARYWRQIFADEIPVLDLPTDEPRPAVMSYEGVQLNFLIGEELAHRLRMLAAQNGATLYMVLLAAYNLLLAKYTGQTDICVGTPVAGRPHSDLEPVIGLFVNTLVMRNQPLPARTFQEFLLEVRENSLKAFENPNYQFDMLVDELGLKRDLSRNPIFDTMFILQNVQLTEIALSDFRLVPYNFAVQTVKFDLLFSGAETAEGIDFEVQYSKKLFRRGTIERIWGHLVNLLENIVLNPGKTLAELGILSPEEKELLLYRFNDTVRDYPLEKTINQLFEEQVERTPEGVALVFRKEETVLTYRELNMRANQLAWSLRAQGVGRTRIVGLMVERSPEMVIGLLAILKAGAAYLPIDPEYPEERIKYMLVDSGADLLLTQPHLQKRINYTGSVYYFGNVFNKQAEECAEPIRANQLTFAEKDRLTGLTKNLPRVNTPEDLLYVIYTSGSTGKPKGVMLEHRNLVNLMFYEFNETNVDYSGKVLQFTTISFDVSFQEIFSTLLAGGELYLITQEQRNDVTQLLKFVEENGINIVFMPVAFLKFVFTEEEYVKSFPRSVEHIITAGEQLIVTPQFRNYLQVNGVFLHNHYGPSETHAGSTLTLSPVEEIPQIPSIGKPIANSQTYILSESMALQPVGVPGDLYISGVNVGRGYLHRPELTVEKYLPDPFRRGQRMYRTGDLARWLPDGQIEFFGRKDTQVKIRGFRVEIGEIETLLLQHSDVKEAVVVAWDDERGSKYLAAYLVSAVKNVTELKDHLKKELPDYMIPAHFIFLERMPLTGSGKIDRRALPKPSREEGGETSYVAPQNATEARLARIWSEVLGVQRIGREDNFFDLGGHSLKATLLTAKIAQEFTVRVPLKEIFKTPILHELALYIRKLGVTEYPTIEPVEAREYYPVSAAQKRLYILNQLHPDSTAYNMPGVFQIEGRLEIKILQEAFRTVIKRHEALRTAFYLEEGEIVQKIAPTVEFALTEFQIGEDQLWQTVADFVQPFDLTQAPLLRIGLLELGKFWVLTCDMHHIISDGVSMGILIAELIQLYSGKELSPLTLQYKDYAVWQNNYLNSQVIKTQEEYWLSNFASGIPELHLPQDNSLAREMHDGGALAGDVHSFLIEEQLATELNLLARHEGVTLFMVLLAAYQILLAKYTGQQDIVVGTPVAGRSHADLQQIIGIFINTLAIRNLPLGEKTFQQFLGEVQNQALAAFENQEYPFEMLVDKLGAVASQGRNPIFDVMFVWQNTEALELQTEALKVTPYQFKNTQAKFALTLIAAESEEGIECHFEFRTGCFQSAAVAKMASDYRKIIQMVIGNPKILLREIALEGELLALEQISLDDIDFTF